MPPTDNGRRVRVRVTQSAFLDMVLATAEAALVSPSATERSLAYLDEHVPGPTRRERGRNASLPPSLIFSDTGLEIAGALFGQVTSSGGETAFTVERMHPISAAIRGDDFVEADPLSFTVMSDLAEAAGSPWQRLGEFHSHPHLDASIAEIERCRLFAPSPSDFSATPTRQSHVPEIALILAITFAESRRKGRVVASGLPENTVRARVSDFELWLSAYIPCRARASVRPRLTLDGRVSAGCACQPGSSRRSPVATTMSRSAGKGR